MSLMGTISHAWNALTTRGDADRIHTAAFVGPSSHARPDRARVRSNADRTIISSIYTRIAIDVASVRIEHCRTDDNGNYKETIKSGLNNCLNIEANLDQGARHFRQDLVLTMLHGGTVAIVPVETDNDPLTTGSWDIRSLRVGEVVEWYPQHVKVRLYDERDGQTKDVILTKRFVAIVENPFYSVMNEPNSTLQRLIRKLSLLDHVDEISSQGKLDIIIQLPYVVKSDSRKAQAERRTKDIQDQLQNSTYGIAYTDGTEKITQLNRSVENNLLAQVQYLKDELYAELGLTAGIMDGTADDVVMLNYINRTVEPIMDAIAEATARTFLTKTARTQNQTIMYFQTPFKLLPISQLAQIVDVLSRNQIVTPNEIRPTLGLKPSSQPQADQLINSNMPLADQITGPGSGVDGDDIVDGELVDEAELALDREMAKLGIS